MRQGDVKVGGRCQTSVAHPEMVVELVALRRVAPRSAAQLDHRNPFRTPGATKTTDSFGMNETSAAQRWESYARPLELQRRRENLIREPATTAPVNARHVQPNQSPWRL